MADKMEVQCLRLGPKRKDWTGEEPAGDCRECGGQCDGLECGLHKAGCIYGGSTERTAYWMIADGCTLFHGEALDALEE